MSTLSRALWRELGRRKAQFISVGVVIALGVALFTASFDAYLNLTDSYKEFYRETKMADVTAIGGPTDAVLQAAKALPDVAATETRSVADVPLQPRPDHTLLGRVVGMPANGQAAVDAIQIIDGEGLDPSRPNAVVMEQHMATHFDFSPGDTLLVSTPSGWQQVEVVGIAASPEYLWAARSRQEVLALPDDFGVIFAPESFVEGLAPTAQQQEVLVRLTDGASPGAVEAARNAVIAAGASDAYTLAEQPSNAALQEDVSGFAEMSVMFPAFFLVAAAFATYVLLGRMIAGQQANIGTLRASGFKRRTILLHYAAIGVILGLVGAVIGVILGAILAEAITRLYTSSLDIPAVVVQVRLTTMAIGLVTGLLTGIVAAVFPARSASRIAPAAAMRGPMPPGEGDTSLLERLIPPLRNLPLRWLTALRGIGRARRRSLATIMGVILATMLVLVSWGMVDTIQILLERQFVQIERQDAELHVALGSADTVVPKVEAVDGVMNVERALAVPISVSHDGATYSTLLTALQPGETMHQLRGTNGSWLPVPDSGVLFGVALKDKLGIAAGDTVSLDVAGLVHLDNVPVAGFVDEPLGTYAYSSLPYAVDEVAGSLPVSTANPGADANLLMVTFDQGADPSVMRAKLSAIDGVQAYVDSKGLYDLAQEFMGFFYVFIGVMIVLGAILAFALIYNTMSANVAERQAELAVLRILGLSRRSIGGLVTAQNMLLTVIGLVPGLIGGWIMAAVFMSTFSSDMFTLQLEIRPLTFVLTAAAIVVVGLVSQWPALRAVGRLDLGRIVRDRSF